MENFLIELEMEREMLSPRDIAVGWRGQLTQNIEDTRRRLSEAKLDLIFRIGLDFECAESYLSRRQEGVLELVFRSTLTRLWNDMESSDIARKNFVRKQIEDRRKRRVAIADERRHWRVRSYNREGKPVKKNKNLSSSQLADLGVADVDLFAFETNRDVNLKAKLDQSALSSYLQQVELYEQLLAPISDVMKGFLGGGEVRSGDPPFFTEGFGPQTLGFGPLGTTLPPAMHILGVGPSKFLANPDNAHRNTNAEDKIELKSDILTPSNSSSNPRNRKSHSASPKGELVICGPAKSSSMPFLHSRERIIRLPQSRALPSLADSSRFSSPKPSTNNTNAQSRIHTALLDPFGLLRSASPPLSIPTNPVKASQSNQSKIVATTSTQSSEANNSSSSSLYPVRPKDDSIETQLNMPSIFETSSSSRFSSSLSKSTKTGMQPRNVKSQKKSRVEKIPWSLLDELTGATEKFESEVNYVEFKLRKNIAPR